MAWPGGPEEPAAAPDVLQASTSTRPSPVTTVLIHTLSALATTASRAQAPAPLGSVLGRVGGARSRGPHRLQTPSWQVLGSVGARCAGPSTLHVSWGLWAATEGTLTEACHDPKPAAVADLTGTSKSPTLQSNPFCRGQCARACEYLGGCRGGGSGEAGAPPVLPLPPYGDSPGPFPSATLSPADGGRSAG